MPQKTQVSSFSTVWEELLKGIKHIYQLQPMNTDSWMKLYTLIFNCCSNVNNLSNKASANRKIQEKKQPTNNYLEGQIVGEELYENIRNYLTIYLETIFQNGVDLRDDNVLRFYSQHWSQYRFPSKVLNGICSYLNTHWVRRNIERGEKDIYEVFILTMKIWENVFFKVLNKQVTEACLNLIKAERNHEMINTNSISEVVQSYIALDCCHNADQLTIYKQFFEDQFLQDTEQFYLLEAATFLSRNSVTEYLRKVAQRLDEEVHRVQSYLHSSTLQPLIKRMEDVLIRDQLVVIYEESKTLLREERDQDLILLFKLISRIPHAINHLKEIVENHMHQVGLDAVKRINGIALSNPKIYIETVLETHKKFVELVAHVFDNKQEFIVARDAACVKFINHNIVTNAPGNATKSPESLARYCDILLRKGNKDVEESALEEKFNEIMAVFNYMEDKDVFEKFYRNRLAKRLVGQLSASNDSEESMISKLKKTCGYEYTLKLQRMIQDIILSKDLNDQYRTDCDSRQIEKIKGFSVMVLTNNSWPFSAPPNLVLPIEIKQMMDSFTKFYSHERGGRKLMWLYQHSNGDLQTSFTETEYTLHVSTYQMNVLLLFNQKPTWLVEQIQDKTQIQKNILLQVLCILLKAKLLICEEVGNASEELKESDIQLDYHIKLADHFKSKNIRINLNVPLKSVEQKDNENVHRTIEEDRKLLIRAVIVRVMKARQTSKHALLMQEVIQQLSSRFRPEISVIKKCIDILIDTDYLKRDPNDRDILQYLA